MNAPSPGMLAAAIKNRHYDTEFNYLRALGEALRVEYEAIVRAGFVLQIDAPDLALERHISFKDAPVSKFVEFIDAVVATINAALKNIPPDRVRAHVCWGNSETPHDADVPLADILPAIQKANAGALYLPFAGPRHAHEFRCFEKQAAHERARERTIVRHGYTIFRFTGSEVVRDPRKCVEEVIAIIAGSPR
jgi:5-methyltetrahydropteroyltriglutamate--homocysteine methyltransferase